MRWLVLIALVACERAEPRETTTPAPVPPPTPAPIPVPPVERTSLWFDWPMMINKPEAEARAAIGKHLQIKPDADLKPLGVDLMVNGGKVDTIFMHIRPESNSGPIYRGSLFRGVKPAMKREEIIGVLGDPDEHREGDVDWIKYNKPEAQIHFQFTGDGSIYMVTLMRPDWVPGSP